MVDSLKWLQGSTGKWHAWPRGGRRSLCGTLTVEHLRAQPAIQITEVFPEGQDLCQSCRRAACVVDPKDSVQGVAGAWVGLLRRHMAHVHVRIAEATLRELANRLAEVGSPDSAEAREVYNQIKSLFLTPLRRTTKKNGKTLTIVTLPYLTEAVAKLPPNTHALEQIASTLRTWRSITQRDPSIDRCRPDLVVEVMLQLPSKPESYIRHLNARGLPNLAAMFHPNTLQRAKKETSLRGMFAGTTEYWNDTEDQLNIIR